MLSCPWPVRPVRLLKTGQAPCRVWRHARAGAGKPSAGITRDALLAFYEGKIAKWWTPDDVVFVDGIPLGATGKMQKNKLREQLAGYKLPSA